MNHMIFCLIGAFVGAGFASGREIVQFFSRWGAASWLLIALAAGCMIVLMQRVMDSETTVSDWFSAGRFRWAGRAVMILLLGCAGGGMTSAAGELAALTAPIRHARMLGGAATLILCAGLARKPLGALSLLGKLLVPALALTLLFCLRLPEDRGETVNHSAMDFVSASAQAAGYAGMNVLLALSVLCDAGAGRSRTEKRRIAWGAGILFAMLLGLANAAFLPRIGELQNAALPMVMLLRTYGKAGYYGAAVVLYLAVISTLIAVLRGLSALLPGRYALPWAALLAGLASQMGFRYIVATAYPVLGLIGQVLLPANKNRRVRA